ncbi:aldo/keto reductase [Halegenticoccus tardaugens]|uniref:aldo/keto reductase n=1 Tax=Halegenticoccus tardaugens TaxID=2071624 RepID=UPI00100B6EE3|nr:aldo/keto reductase [Halegenticoccus tardaugens]
MEHVELQGVRLPKVGLGTWRLAGPTCEHAVATALDLGYRHLDTAQLYGNERRVGRALSASPVAREEVFLTTKLAPGNLRADAVRRSAAESLDRLDTDYLDLLLVHWPNPRVPLRETLGAMSELVDEGAVRRVGVSNFGPSRLRTAREVSDVPILTDQVQFHPYRPKPDLLSYCREHDLALTAYSPLAHGGVLDDDVLRRVGERYDKSPAQVALRWAVQQENVAVIPKATSRSHLAENLDVFDFELTEPEMRAVARPSLLRTAIGFVRGRLGV